MEEYTHKDFGAGLADLVREHQGRPWRPSIQAFADEIGVNYHTLRSAMMGRTKVTEQVMETVASVLGVRPTYFKEYRLRKIAGILDSDPQFVGKVYDYAVGLREELEREKAEQ